MSSPVSGDDNLIFTFRTITTLINVLQNANIPLAPPNLRSVDNETPSKADKKVLKLLGALATLFVRDHEVTATASKFLVKGPTNDLDIKIIAVVANPNRKTNNFVGVDALKFVGDSPAVVKPQMETRVNLQDPITYVLESW
jgi:hypothetical protein